MKYILIFAATIWMCQSVHALHGHFGDLLKRDNTSIESGDHIANDETSDNGISVPMQIKLIFEKRRKNKNSIENQNYGNGIGKNKKNHREGKGKGKNRKQKGKKHTGKGGRKNHPEKQKDKFDMAEFESIPKKITDDGINEFGKLSQLTQLTLESENENEDGLINAEYDDEICPKSIKNQNKILHKVGKKKLKRAGRSIHNSFKKNGKKLHKFVEYVNNIDPIQNTKELKKEIAVSMKKILTHDIKKFTKFMEIYFQYIIFDINQCKPIRAYQINVDECTKSVVEKFLSDIQNNTHIPKCNIMGSCEGGLNMEIQDISESVYIFPECLSDAYYLIAIKVNQFITSIRHESEAEKLIEIMNKIIQQKIRINNDILKQIKLLNIQENTNNIPTTDNTDVTEIDEITDATTNDDNLDITTNNEDLDTSGTADIPDVADNDGDDTTNTNVVTANTVDSTVGENSENDDSADDSTDIDITTDTNIIDGTENLDNNDNADNTDSTDTTRINTVVDNTENTDNSISSNTPKNIQNDENTDAVRI